ncbi:ribosomal protein S18-alanine N-acetyltransferase [Vibrio sp. S4M6]|uniref:ribosomal protein S18-alanine N-acetyltransferase n=1 Tax=Vibrio sinus TaxID=2946865 RepID=UPI002029ED35|nr:ribosomal protein S18-alanine N-acetyltransferase [Vibrio sinus]MCL9781126.1 ribosomal protein S18-alanine N-acetyltransferase [Vibrio sinus]
MNHNLKLVPLQEPHLNRVFDIEQKAHSHPWSKSLLFNLDSRGAFHHALLKDDRLIGYFYAQNIVGEVTLLNVAIDPNQQGSGCGKWLIEHFLELCMANGAESVWLEVRESNHRAYGLYLDMGFNEVDRRVDYYPTANGKEDAIIMSYML